MSKLLTKITIYSLGISSVIGGTFYLTSVSGDNNTVSSNNFIVAKENISQATLVSVWDKETEPNYSGTTQMTVYRS